MKLFTVIDIPDEDYELSDRWVIDVDGDIRYESENGDALLHYKSPQYDYELRPLPKKLVGKQTKYMPVYSLGWDDCIDEITGE